MVEREDLQVCDILTHIRQHPEMYLADGYVNGATIVCRILADVLVSENCQVFVQRSGDWWIIGSSTDWIGSVGTRAFFEFMPYPQAGQNSFHGEVLITAFAADIVLLTPYGHDVIAGRSPIPEQIIRLSQLRPELRRIVCFRM